MPTSNEARSVLVTGAAGFIGSFLAARLLDEGVAVVGLDNMNHYYDPKLNLPGLRGSRHIRDFVFTRAILPIQSLSIISSMTLVQISSSIWERRQASGIRLRIPAPISIRMSSAF